MHAVWKKSETVSGSTDAASVQGGCASFEEREFSFEATVFCSSSSSSSSSSSVPEPHECEPKPFELQILSGKTLLASARINLSEYLAMSSWINLASQLRSVTPGSPPVTLKFCLRCTVAKITPARPMNSSKNVSSPNVVASSPSPVTPLGRRVLDTPMSDRSDMNSSTGSVANESMLNESQQQDDLRFEVARLKAALEAQSTELQQLGDDHEEAQADVNRLKAALEEQSREFALQSEALQARLRESEGKALRKDVEAVEMGLRAQEAEREQKRLADQRELDKHEWLQESERTRALFESKLTESERHQILHASRVEVLEAMVQRLESDSAKQNAELKTCRLQLEETQSKLATSEETLARRQRDLHQSSQELQTELEAARSALESSKKVSDDKAKSEETLRKHAQALEDQVKQLEDQLLSSKKMLEDKVADALKRLDDEKHHHAEAVKQLEDSKNAAVAELKKALDDEKACLAEEKKKVADVQKRLDDALATLNDSKNGAAAELDKARTALSVAIEGKSKLELELAEFKKKHEDSQKQQDEAKRAFEEETSKQVAEYKSKQAETQKQLDAALATLNDSKNGAAAELDKARRALSVATEAKSVLEADLNKLRGALETKESDLAAALKDVADEKKKNDEWQKKIDVLTLDAFELKRKLDSSLAECESMQRSLRESQTGAADLDELRKALEHEKRERAAAEQKMVTAATVAEEQLRASTARLKAAEDSLEAERNRVRALEAAAANLTQERAANETMVKKAADMNTQLEQARKRQQELMVALDLAKEQRADERERAQELEGRVEELAAQLEQEHAAMRKKIEAAETKAADNAARAAQDQQNLKRLLEQKTAEQSSAEKIAAQLRERVETLESARAERDVQLATAEARVRDGLADRGRLLERVAELERALANKEEKTSEQLASLRRDLDKQAEGRADRLVREIVERNVYLGSQEFDKDANPLAAVRLLDELEAQDEQVQSGVLRAAAEFARAEGQSVAVAARVGSMCVALAKLARARGKQNLSQLSSRTAATAVLPAIVSAVLRACLATARRPGHVAANKNAAAVPVQGAAVASVWKQSLESMISNKLSVPIISALFGAIVAQLDRYIFNQIVGNSVFCTFGCGLQLKVIEGKKKKKKSRKYFAVSSLTIHRKPH